MYPYRLPLKFILLWSVNLAVLVALSLLTGFHEILLTIIRGQVTWIYLAAGALLAAIEEWFIDKLKGNT